MEIQLFRRPTVNDIKLELMLSEPIDAYMAISKEEEKMWNAWLPDGFGGSVPLIEPDELADHFSDKGIEFPKKVKQELALNKKLFGYYLIDYVRHGRQYEVLLKGWPRSGDDDQYEYLIARWGQKLLPAEQIKKYLAKSRRKEFLAKFLLGVNGNALHLTRLFAVAMGVSTLIDPATFGRWFVGTLLFSIAAHFCKFCAQRVSIESFLKQYRFQIQ